MRTKTCHSSYYYAKKYGKKPYKPYSNTADMLDELSYHRPSNRYDPSLGIGIAMLGVAIAVDIGLAVREEIRKMTDPVERARMYAESQYQLRKLRRPLYYARETERRRQLAAERHKIKRRTTLAPIPTAEALLDAWNHRKDSKENMIILGGMLHDLECYVDNRLKIDEDGHVVGRNRGIRGWIAFNLPELSPKYKTLMRYKAMAIKLRQATDTKAPKPTSELLTENPRHEVVETILENFRTTFSFLEDTLEYYLSPDMVLRDKPEIFKVCQDDLRE